MSKTKDKTILLTPRSGRHPPYLSGKEHENWTRALPYNVNPRAILIHRVKHVTTYFDVLGRPRHDGVTHWCGTTAFTNHGISLTADPPKDRLLCVNCEVRAIEAGQLTSRQLTGRHVHVGSLRAVRECCTDQSN